MMKRREFLAALTTGAVSGVLLNGQRLLAADEKPALTRTPLVLMAPRPDGVEAIWAVKKLCKGRIEWETEDGMRGQAGTDDFGFTPQGDDVLRVRLSGLKKGCSYRLRSITVAADNGQAEVSEWKPFKTLNPDADQTEFVVWNDTHINNQTIQQLHEATPTADFLVWNGDTCNNWTAPEFLVPTLLHPGERDITKGRPLFVTWGNHDVRGPHAFEMPNMVATPNGRPFYAFRSGPVAAICLHTGEDKPDSHPSFEGRVAFDNLRREQAAWLAEIIREPEMKDAPYRAVFCHIPLRWRVEKVPDYKKGGFDHFSLRSREAWNKALTEWKAQVIISGHTHQSAWLPATEQFRYSQLVGGGPQPKAATWISGKASPEGLLLKVQDLSAKVRHEVKISPLV